MFRNFMLVIEYDGAAYHGWQRQKEASTIQGTVEVAVATMTGRAVRVIGSGRTDAGVHALNQVANFVVDTRLSPEAFQKGLTSLVPPDIVIKSCREVPQAFHAQFDAKSKVYEYRILNQPFRAALYRQYAWHIRNPLDLGAMDAAAIFLKGTHDFAAFESAGSPRSHTVRTVLDLSLNGPDRDGYVTFVIEANGFLKGMVRNIVGTLAHVGLGKLRPAEVKGILDSRDRTTAGPRAPANGLFLREVKYGARPPFE